MEKKHVLKLLITMEHREPAILMSFYYSQTPSVGLDTSKFPCFILGNSKNLTTLRKVTLSEWSSQGYLLPHAHHWQMHLVENLFAPICIHKLLNFACVFPEISDF